MSTIFTSFPLRGFGHQDDWLSRRKNFASSSLVRQNSEIRGKSASARSDTEVDQYDFSTIFQDYALPFGSSVSSWRWSWRFRPFDRRSAVGHPAAEVSGTESQPTMFRESPTIWYLRHSIPVFQNTWLIVFRRDHIWPAIWSSTRRMYDSTIPVHSTE